MTAPENVAVLLPYVVAGMAFDLATRRRIHPAYLWGFGALVAMAVVIELVAAIQPFASFATSIAS